MATIRRCDRDGKSTSYDAGHNYLKASCGYRYRLIDDKVRDLCPECITQYDELNLKLLADMNKAISNWFWRIKRGYKDGD